MYMDDYLVFSKNNSGIFNNPIHSLTHGKEHIEFTDEAVMSKYIGVDVSNSKYGSIEFTQ